MGKTKLDMVSSLSYTKFYNKITWSDLTPVHPWVTFLASLSLSSPTTAVTEESYILRTLQLPLPDVWNAPSLLSPSPRPTFFHPGSAHSHSSTRNQPEHLPWLLSSKSGFSHTFSEYTYWCIALYLSVYFPTLLQNCQGKLLEVQTEQC